MAYDEEFAERIRAELGTFAEFSERKMFGGIAFMVNTHMACGVMGEKSEPGLMVRVGKDNHAAAIARGAQEMAFTGRPMRGMVIVPLDELEGPQLAEWLEGAVNFAMSEPPKPAKR